MTNDSMEFDHEEADAAVDDPSSMDAAAAAYDPDTGDDRDLGGNVSPDIAMNVEQALGAFHREVDAFAEEFPAELSDPVALESFNKEMDVLSRFKAPGFDDVMRLTEAGNHPAVVRTGRALARRVLQLEAELAAIRRGAGDREDVQARRALEEEWQSLRDKTDYWTNPAVQRRSREIAEALFGTDPVGAGAIRTAVGVHSHREGV